MPILEADFIAGLRIVGTAPAVSVNTMPLFDKGAQVYRKSDLKVLVATNQRDFDWVPYTVRSITAKLFDDGGTTKFESQTSNVAATSDDLPVNPIDNGDGNITCVWFYEIVLGTSDVIYNVPIADLLEKADAKVYYATQVALL